METRRSQAPEMRKAKNLRGPDGPNKLGVRRLRRVAWKRVLGPRAFPIPYLPLNNNLHPAGQETPARRHGALGLPQQSPVEPPRVLSWCAARDGRWGAKWRAPEWEGEGSGAPGATQTPTSPSSAHAGTAPDPPGRRHCPPTRPRAGQRSRDSERESPEALPARRCAELGL